MTDATVGAVHGWVLAKVDPETRLGAIQGSVLGVPLPTEAAVLNAVISVLGDPSPTQALMDAHLVSVLGVPGSDEPPAVIHLQDVARTGTIKRKINDVWEPIRVVGAL